MVSKRAEQFLVELRMYLISKGKNDQEINEITEELEDHLTEAEAAGKDVSHIIGDSPKNYMKSIGESMKTDYRQLAGLVPLMILLLTAYLSIGPAIEGTFSVSQGTIWFALVISSISILVYGLFLFKVMPKFFQSKWNYVLFTVTFLAVTGLMIAFMFWYKSQEFEVVFVATPAQNNLIIVLCAVIFIGAALYTKTWFTVLIPLFLSMGPIATRFVPEEANNDPLYITITILAFLLASAVAIAIFIFQSKKDQKKI
ncbi:DUF1129 family protein [Mesobacillus selenatarsenatis]|uniref:Membrane protein n=1 Tax=Mesobacillus selenatarsenatis (strain DSM 18680 / JCM 14380 / FERM P-15431 / SF-1) TaxID=1321606 RepID=A0A0A8X9R0_MESS1|nr:DUF1129 family protein [Mesobacillus selenatarsenatis]GAM16678.1 membrane protein [Mesobacillus selenatarsenatis SF-1]